MKIDEAVFDAVAMGYGAMPGSVERLWLQSFLDCYLAALPSAEPGRDRIAVVVNAYGGGTADVMPADPNLFDWEQLEAAAGEFEIEGPFAHNVVACRLRYYEPSEPVEVEGSVEGVGP